MTDASQPVLTAEGKQKLEEELIDLKTVKRKLIADKIEAAKEMGDISENAEYASAKDEQAFLEARIVELEKVLAYAEVVQGTGSGETIGVGATVGVETETGSSRQFTIVGYNEANPSDGKISNESPLGQALMGKRLGEFVTISTPNGPKVYKIAKIF